MSERTIEVEHGTAELSRAALADLDRQWAGIKAGEPTVAHDDVVRWLDIWGTSRFRSWKSR